MTPMLILTRRPEEVIRIGDEITVTLLGIHGNQVRIGIDAPRDVPVHRLEIYNRIQAQQHRASWQEPTQLMSMRVVSAGGEVREKRAELRERTQESAEP